MEWEKKTFFLNFSSSISPCHCSRGVVVITCASHAQGPRFDPGREHFLSKLQRRLDEITKSEITMHQLPRGLVVRIRRSHRRGPGSIPGQGSYTLSEAQLH